MPSHTSLILPHLQQDVTVKGDQRGGEGIRGHRQVKDNNKSDVVIDFTILGLLRLGKLHELRVLLQNVIHRYGLRQTYQLEKKYIRSN